MTHYLREQDLPIWLAARPWLDVRSNDEHTLISYRLGQALLRLHPDADASVVLPAILMHDVGWKKFPPEQLAAAVGPNPRYPELQRAHEIEGVKIAAEAFTRLAIPGLQIDTILAIIDGHDTRKKPISREDALMKDADKLWRFTGHGVATIGGWFETPPRETLAMLESFVLPSMLTEAGATMAQALIAEGVASAFMTDLLHIEVPA
ncbi:HD domain-containing protein [Bradyrhizobium oligotrophicum]|uniref:HD domain-containing protein n=1 Tax=Bradyrhizobium oligotrophicum TaxID=44255 RepID=UPI003EBC1327